MADGDCGWVCGGLVSVWHTLAVVAPTPESWEKPLAVAPIRQYTLATTEAKPRLSAHSVWIYDRKTKETLLEQEAQVATAPASLVKMMTALVAFDRFDLDQPVTIGSAAGILGIRAKFLPQDQFVVRDLLTTMLMFSANDAGEALAQATASPTSFIEDMNFKAEQFGLEHTHFTNVTGLDDPAQFSTAQDLGRLLSPPDQSLLSGDGVPRDSHGA